MMNVYFFFFRQKTAYEMRISDWSSDVCSSDLARRSVERRLDIRHSAHFARYCPSAFEIGGGHAQVGIGGERTFDQRVESWIVIEPPPAWRQRRLRHSGRGLDRKSTRLNSSH